MPWTLFLSEPLSFRKRNGRPFSGRIQRANLPHGIILFQYLHYGLLYHLCSRKNYTEEAAIPEQEIWGISCAIA
jgi:hypothetical protein